MNLPGDKNHTQYINEMIRVNHAGEYGAKIIYKAQIRFIKDQEIKKTIKHMAKQEKDHLEYFEKELIKRKIRPSALLPFWHIAGYLLGASTAIIGNNAAMIATKAIEEVIEEHYQSQIEKLDKSEEKLKNNIEKFLQDEIEHKDQASNNLSESRVLHSLFANLIKKSCKLAISIAKKI